MFEAEPGLMIWTVISFVILLVLLRKFAYKPLVGMMHRREETIKESIEEAKRTRESAEELYEQYKKLIDKARDEAKKIIDEGKTLGEQARKEMVTKANDESAQVVKRAQEQIAFEKERALSELREQIADLSIMAASKVIDRSLSLKDHEKLLEEYISSIGEVDAQ
ncbi:MAG: F0F1 ATP synthase subunit B [Gemmatimonadota bacterium]|nr:MAG: F0F1 ATP synthase subunit B [Gemmatimonadota bacterium]